MTIRTSIEIDLPPARVAQLLLHPSAAYCQAVGELERTQLAGEAGRPGSSQRIVQRLGQGTFQRTETLVAMDLPRRIDRLVALQGQENRMSHILHDLGGGRTRYILVQRIGFKGLHRILGWIFRWTYRAPSLAAMRDFKAWAEAEGEQNSL